MTTETLPFLIRLSKAYRAIPAVIEKSKEAARGRGRYAPAENVLPIIRKACIEQGILLMILHNDSDDNVGAIVRLQDEYNIDNRIETPISFKVEDNKHMSSYQSRYAGHTYMDRRSVAALFGVVTGDDIDPDDPKFHREPLQQPATLAEVEAVLETTTPESWPTDKQTVRSLLTRMPKGTDRQRAIELSAKTNALMSPPA